MLSPRMTQRTPSTRLPSRPADRPDRSATATASEFMRSHAAAACDPAPSTASRCAGSTGCPSSTSSPEPSISAGLPAPDWRWTTRAARNLFCLTWTRSRALQRQPVRRRLGRDCPHRTLDRTSSGTNDNPNTTSSITSTSTTDAEPTVHPTTTARPRPTQAPRRAIPDRDHLLDSMGSSTNADASPDEPQRTCRHAQADNNTIASDRI